MGRLRKDFVSLIPNDPYPRRTILLPVDPNVKYDTIANQARSVRFQAMHNGTTTFDPLIPAAIPLIATPDLVAVPSARRSTT